MSAAVPPLVPSPSARSFFPNGEIPAAQCRAGYTVADVPATAEGIRMLARDGNWSAVAELASFLEQQAAGASAGVGATLGVLESRLQYTLAQVTAYFKMERYVAAKKVIDDLGDLSSDRFINPRTNRCIAPFSLRFLAALLPMYVGAIMESQRKLYALLEPCEEGSAGETPTVWRARAKRVKRALVANHFQAEQYSAAMSLLWGLAEEENDEPRYLLLLQQFGCLCLRCGNYLSAQQAFRLIDNLPLDDECDELQDIRRFISVMNKAFVMAFFGHFADAASHFAKVAEEVSHYRTPTMTADGAMVRSLLHMNAVVSHLTCLPYMVPSATPAPTSMPTMLATMERYIHTHPRETLSSHAFLSNAVRLYTLEGNDKAKRIDLLTELIELFRSDKQSIPRLDKLV